MILESCDKNIAFEKLVYCFGHAAANFIRDMFKHRDGSYMGYLWILFQQLRKGFIISQVTMKDDVRKATFPFTNVYIQHMHFFDVRGDHRRKKSCPCNW